MFKRHIASFTIFIFFITMLPAAFGEKVYAYQNSGYFNNVRVGLLSMSSTNITATLNGDYTLNRQVYPSGSILNIGLNGTSITLDVTVQSEIVLTPNNSSNLLTLTSGLTSNKYLGSFLIKSYNGKVLPINTIDIENYLKGVVRYEMADNYPIEALKAQAVGARNYAISRIGYGAANGYDFDDTPVYQTYKGYDAALSNVIRAVDQTKGQVLLYNDKLVEALYSADQILKFYYQNVYLQNLITSPILTTFTQSTNSLLAGDTISFNATATSGSGAYLYKYVVMSGSNVVYTRDYSNVSSLDYVSSAGGRCNVQVYLKNQDSTADYQDIKTSAFTVYEKPLINSFTANKSQYLVGQTVNLNTTANLGSGNYLYKYVISLDGAIISTVDYRSNANLLYVVNSAGNYNITVYMKDVLSTKDYDEMKTLTVTAYNQPTMTYTTTKSSILIGNTVNYAINEVNGSGNEQYRFVVLNGSNVVADSSYSTSNTFSFRPLVGGFY